jgi:hypothetical protein
VKAELIALFSLTLAGVMAVTGARHSAGSEDLTTVPVEPPLRTATARPAGLEAPPLPAAAESLAPLKITIRTSIDGGATTTQLVTRTRDRVRLVLEGGRREWLFRRNPVHPERVDGDLIDHDARQILAHDDTQLLAGLGLRGWADVIMMRFDPRLLPSLRATGAVERRGGAAFKRFLAADQEAQGIVDVWWSEPLLLPLRMTVHHGARRITATIISFGPAEDPPALEAAASRFPDYESLDAVDAKEPRH